MENIGLFCRYVEIVWNTPVVYILKWRLMLNIVEMCRALLQIYRAICGYVGLFYGNAKIFLHIFKVCIEVAVDVESC